MELRHTTLMNIAGAESLSTALAFKPYLDREAFGLVQFDIATTGFTEGLKVAHLTAAHRKPLAIHSWGTVVSALAGLHLALTLPNCAATEYCFLDHPLNDRLSVSPVRPVSGYLQAPIVPGLGVKFDEGLLKEFPYSPSSNTMISTEERDIRLSK